MTEPKKYRPPVMYTTWSPAWRLQNPEVAEAYPVSDWEADDDCRHLLPGLRALGPGGPRGLLLLGPVGTGKTYAAVVAAYKYFIAAGGTPSTTVRIVGYPNLRRRLGAAIDASRKRDRNAETVDDILSSFVMADVLVLDDLAVGRGSEYTQDILWSVLDRRCNRREGLTVATSNVHPHDRETWYEHIGDRGWSRLMALVGDQVYVLRGRDRRIRPAQTEEPAPWEGAAPVEAETKEPAPASVDELIDAL